MSSKYVVCYGKEYMPGKNKFTEIGVGFETKDGKGIRLQIDIPIILNPTETLFVFLRNSHEKKEGGQSE
jgi:hypothetical protein